MLNISTESAREGVRNMDWPEWAALRDAARLKLRGDLVGRGCTETTVSSVEIAEKMVSMVQQGWRVP
jgi:hypothetical protein